MVALLGLVAGCGEQTGTDAQPDGSWLDAKDGETSVVKDVLADGETVADVPRGPAYPEGPFGYGTGMVMADLDFYDPLTEGALWLNQWYQDPNVKLLMLLSTVGW